MMKSIVKYYSVIYYFDSCSINEDDIPKKLCNRLILKYISTISYAFYAKLRITAMTTTGKKQVYSTSKFALRRDITYTLCFEQWLQVKSCIAYPKCRCRSRVQFKVLTLIISFQYTQKTIALAFTIHCYNFKNQMSNIQLFILI